ncbi:MAG: sigma-70 family RNA polymerase sigma factor [Thermorudis peleae]|nr:sigma-70 family RNA polymerase sigma factor [Thermorudis peleae]
MRARQPEALAQLYDRYAAAVYSLARMITRDDGAAEDVTQEVFLRLWQAPELYVPERGPFAPWLLRVTRNRALDWVRQRRRGTASLAVMIDEHGIEPVGGGEDPAALAERTILAEHVRQALAELEPSQRQVLELAYFAGLTQREMADMLGIPLGTVKTRVRTGLRRLADLLTRERIWTETE